MFGKPQTGAKAYAKVSVETGVGTATPHKLIAMLFDGAIIAVNSAIEFMKAGNVARKGEVISRAILIIDSGLRASLNKEVGGEIALNLDALYEYMSLRLVTANMENNVDMLIEVQSLLRELMGAWGSIASNVSQAIPANDALIALDVQPAPSVPPEARDMLAPRSASFVSA